MEFMSPFLSILCFIDETLLPALNPIGQLIKLLYNWIGSYGWTVVLFTVFLKMLTLPLDYWQKLVMKRNSVKMEEMKPLLANIDKQYGHDQRKANEEKSKLNKKYGYSVAASCLPMIITLVVFFFMLSGINSYTSYISKRDYLLLNDAYNVAFDEAIAGGDGEYAAIEKGKDAVAEAYGDTVQEKFLWIKNIWRPDTWSAPMTDVNTFYKELPEAEKALFRKEKYILLYESVTENYPGYFSKTGADGKPTAGWNGLLILPILAIVLSFLSTFLMQKQSKASVSAEPDPTQQSNKMMMFLMPIMMGVFAFIYTAAFALYMVSNSLLSILANFVMQPIIDRKVAKEKIKAAPQASYKRQ